MLSRHILFICIAVAASLGMVRLGVWQLARLDERRAFNAVLRARLDSTVVRPEALPTDTALVRYRRVRLDGAYDIDRELLITQRTRNGSPGVFLVTPLRRTGSDTAILVVRGWVYSSNAKDVADLARWRVGAVANVEAFADTYPIGNAGPVRADSTSRAIRRLDMAAVAATLPYPVMPWYAMLLRDEAAPVDTTRPVAFTRPAVDDEGPHKSYAVQWFCFALTTLVVTVAFIRHDRRKERGLA